MTIEQINTLSVLNGLIATNGGSHFGFTTAAAEISDPNLKPLFTVLGEQRAAFLRELQDLAGRFGGADEDPAAADLVSRRWSRLRRAIAEHDTPAVLEECERGEDAASAAYTKALGVERLMPDARKVVERQAASVKQAYEQISHLREEIRP